MAHAQVAALLEGREYTYRAERRYRRKDGTYMWGLVAGSLVRDENDQPAYLLVQMSDIDKQKRAEDALRLSETRWKYALEGGGQGVWDNDRRDGRRSVFYSRTWRLMRGFGADEQVDDALETWLERVHPDDRARLRETVRRQDAGEIPRNAFEYREKHRDGHYIWILSRGGPVEWDKDGRPTRFVGTDTDISTLKAAETAAAVEKEKLRVTLHSIGDGVVTTDAQGFVTFMNPAAENMTGWESADAVGRAVEEVFVVVDEATGARVHDPVREALRSDRLHYLDEDAVLISRGGERRAVRDSAAPVRTPEGELLGAVLVFQDITSARTLQKELAHSAMHDALTGLANRGAFERTLATAIDEARHEWREHALCFVDLDHFKAVNDSAGHAAGDALLKQIAHAIRRACRSHDFTARIGGDEFAVVLADCSIGAARKVAEHIAEAVASVQFVWQGREYKIGASIGITAITPRSPHLTEVMSQADQACYAAKAAGRNAVVVFDPTLHGAERFARSA
jgi:diguanylate cyclase (GGDEF)-like protein/PAS domain S-box-containing protein